MLKRFFSILIFSNAIFCSNLFAQNVGTAFTYQGELRDGANAAAGLYDFEFRLFDALSAGAQVGTVVSVADVTVTNGIFTAALDFGDQFTGQKRFLAISVKQDAQPSFTALVPRQELRPSPYAQHADFVADGTVVSATILDGTINSLDLADNSVTTNKIANLAVTNAKLAASAVTSSKIANGAVGLAQINTTQVQARISGSCPSGQPLLGFDASGNPTCDESIIQPSEVNLPALGSRVSIALRTNGNPVISYQNTSDDLRMLNCLDDLCSERNFLLPNTGMQTNGFSTVAVRGDNMPIIAFSSPLGGVAGNFLQVADCNSSDCSTATFRNLYTNGLITGSAEHVDMALRASDQPFIVFREILQSGLFAYDCDNSDCSTGTVRNLITTNDTGFQPSVVIRSTGRPIISYKDVTNGDLRIWDCNNADCTGGTERIIDSGNPDIGSESDIAQNSLGDIVIAYRDESSTRLRLAHCELADCDNSIATNVTTTTIDVDTGTQPVVLIRADDRPLIFYRDNRIAELDLKVHDCANIKCTSGTSFVVEGGQGLDRGKWPDVALRSSGRPIAVYNDLDAVKLRVHNCSNETCTNP